MVLGGEDRDEGAQIAEERFLLAEHQPPNVRVEPVRADHDVEQPGCGSFERHLGAARVLGDLRDRVVEEELHVVADRFVQGVHEVPAEDLHFRDRSAGVAEEVGAHARDRPVGGVDVRHAPRPHVGRADPVHDAHPVGDDAGGPTDVDGVATFTGRRRPLDDRRLVAQPMEPVGQGQPRHAGARDEDVPAFRPLLPVHGSHLPWVRE